MGEVKMIKSESEQKKAAGKYGRRSEEGGRREGGFHSSCWWKARGERFTAAVSKKMIHTHPCKRGGQRTSTEPLIGWRLGSLAMATSLVGTPESTCGNATLPWQGEGGRITQKAPRGCSECMTKTQRERALHSPSALEERREGGGRAWRGRLALHRRR